MELKLRFADETSKPKYMTTLSAGADLKSRVDLVIAPGMVEKVPTGVWIESVEGSPVEQNGLSFLPEIQIRARSGLAYKHAVSLANGVGTVDADYRDEICVLLINHGKEDFQIKAGDRVAQMALCWVSQVRHLEAGGTRMGGFGSTGVKNIVPDSGIANA